jgi:hypothetical protein
MRRWSWTLYKLNRTNQILKRELCYHLHSERPFPMLAFGMKDHENPD